MVACGWEVLGCDDCSAYTGLDPAVQAEVEAWAVNRLWEWTNQRFGPCELTVHTDDEHCCWLRANATSPCRRNEILIPAPAMEIISVFSNGEELDLETLHLDNYAILVRDDGLAFRDPWEVTYLHGEEVPPGGSLVAGILACEYAKSLCGDGSCRLPKRVSSVQRQGVVINNFSSRSTEQGITGIFEIDDWVMSANKPYRRSYASSPDVSRPRIMTWSYADS